MRKALVLAAKASGRTSPNPMVGALIVKNGRIIAGDYHRQAGTPHAEALVLRKVGEKARASTLYVTLEPCCHTGKRTPPCTQELIKAGVSTVVAAMKDPNPKVLGKGLRELEQAGITVVSGVLEEEARRLNEAYVKYIVEKKPFVILKVAMTLDGKIATAEGESKWITGEKARKVVHRLRSSVDAVLTAIGTVKADDPQLTARIRGGRNPIRVVIDPDLEIPPGSRLLQVPPETIIVTKEDGETGSSAKNKKYISLVKSGIKLLSFKVVLDLNWLMRKLAENGITSLLTEGGSSMNARLLEAGVVDKVMFFIAPRILGGRDSYPAVGGKTLKRLEDAQRLRDVSVKRLGEDILVEGYPDRSKPLRPPAKPDRFVLPPNPSKL
ncbi:MAG: bifunctional diaminohydroxyphosphoribosylaminopyrimidine deaminase/5-amino-6-(5-phosphoribosylamino)uracil reductase RibD [Nitrospirae bacterium]|nr:bifunctional diaminohydroxyphosphoribosylaminopyrimidine deaminase/5-amino-6-(5-phosphoribosylamino)uracil reductase RibD [Nitrospirota bacterium]